MRITLNELATAAGMSMNEDILDFQFDIDQFFVERKNANCQDPEEEKEEKKQFP